ncbi:lipopolysaccharide transport periplasmic protein LptA [Parahaliea mediterranea]|uniref:lipopolysaccharide transport periplasmic protein LptA n=1 Tax=Parahaliea mediterranea TaxID=651086 RepID=UPI0013008836|nr:lipopolysaccharide transport periplasmic protein LptA [Parahaliea mediterranea]
MYKRGPEPAPRAPARLLAAALLLAAGAALALPEDRQEPIRISADKAVRDEKKGFTVYQGNVMMQQGTLRIDAAKVTVFHEDKEADRIMAEGSPAHMREQPQADKGLMHARAEVIEYFKAEERVLLKRNASVEQDGSKVAGDSIEYFIGQQLIRADSSASDSGRVEVVIPASALPNNQQDEGATAPPQDSPEEKPGGATDGQ